MVVNWWREAATEEEEDMEKAQLHIGKMRFSFKKATIVLCIFNLITTLILLNSFLSSRRLSLSNQPNSILLRHMKEFEELRRAMQPLELIRRVREIQKEADIELDAAQEKVAKQSAAVDLISRLNNYRSNSDTGSVKALEEWRKRKIERARQRGLGKNATADAQA